MEGSGVSVAWEYWVLRQTRLLGHIVVVVDLHDGRLVATLVAVVRSRE